MDAFYRRFLQPGDLAFDLGSHVGNRIRSWRALGARVVAVEPQPALVRTLKLLYGRDRNVHILASAVGARDGGMPLHLNLANPTLSTALADFIAHAQAAPSFHGQRWRATIEVLVVSLDGLIAAHGAPNFVKIDIEGHEAEALRGLSQLLPALSFEFVPMHRAVAEAALDRLEELGDYRFNASLGDQMLLLHSRPAHPRRCPPVAAQPRRRCPRRRPLRQHRSGTAGPLKKKKYTPLRGRNAYHHAAARAGVARPTRHDNRSPWLSEAGVAMATIRRTNGQ